MHIIHIVYVTKLCNVSISAEICWMTLPTPALDILTLTKKNKLDAYILHKAPYGTAFCMVVEVAAVLQKNFI